MWTCLRRECALWGGPPPFPTTSGGGTYHFDAKTAAEIEELASEARALADVLNFPRPPGMEGRTQGTEKWYVSDTSQESFGMEVPEDALCNPDLCVVRDTMGLVKMDEVWMPMSRLHPDRLQAWKLKMWTGPGRDPRLAAAREVAQEALNELGMVKDWLPPKALPPHFGLQGPPTVQEFFMALRAAGKTLVQYDSDWRTSSGVPARGGIARFHTALCELLRLLITIDKMDPSNIAAAELGVRWIITIERAVERNPRAPDWDGLEHAVAGRITSSGAAEVAGFMTWLSGVQRDQAQVLKQGRMLREERIAESKRGKQDPKGKGKGKQHEEVEQ